MTGVMSYEDFYAIHDHMPGSDGALRIGGTVVFREGGWSAELRPHKKEGPTGINPFIYYVDLVITPPAEGAGSTTALTPFKLTELRVENPPEYHEVHFKVVGGDGDEEPPDRLEVQHPE